MKRVILAMLLMVGFVATLSAAESVIDDRAVIMGDEKHPDKGLLYQRKQVFMLQPLELLVGEYLERRSINRQKNFFPF